MNVKYVMVLTLVTSCLGCSVLETVVQMTKIPARLDCVYIPFHIICHLAHLVRVISDKLEHCTLRVVGIEKDLVIE